MFLGANKKHAKKIILILRTLFINYRLYIIAFTIYESKCLKGPIPHNQ